MALFIASWRLKSSTKDPKGTILVKVTRALSIIQGLTPLFPCYQPGNMRNGPPGNGVFQDVIINRARL